VWTVVVRGAWCVVCGLWKRGKSTYVLLILCELVGDGSRIGEVQFCCDGLNVDLGDGIRGQWSVDHSTSMSLNECDVWVNVRRGKMLRAICAGSSSL
jgi:polynucleotide 5'-kinase involved in rRNA processing